jgi:toxin YoeB
MVHKPKLAVKITQLLENIVHSPYCGLGKPEPLRYEFSGFWSRRIDDQHRLVYRVDADGIYVLQCRWHYQKTKP